jgi:hypothetical protein
MDQEATNWVPAVTAGIGALAALGGQFVAGLFQRHNQARTEANQRRERAAEILAEARAFLTDVDPDPLGLGASDETSPQVLTELGERRERTRIPLLTMAGSHPSREVRSLARQLEVEMASTLHVTRLFISDLLRNRDVEPARENANRHHAQALGLLDQLVDAIQRA